jgi:membrane-associated phospholipid phosphatase
LRNNSKLVSFLQARLSPEGYLGLHLTIGLLIITLSTWIFSNIAEDVHRKDRLTVFDEHFSNLIFVKGPEWFTNLMLIITHAHATIPLTLATFAIGGILVWKKHKYSVWALGIAVGGGMLLNVMLKNVFQRARPIFENPLLTFTSYGFPSGHTMAATCFWGFLAALAFSQIKSLPKRVAAIAFSVLMILLVGFSRIYLGAHYLSDVLGAMLEGLAWLAFTLTAVETFRRARRQRRAREENRV